MDTFTEELVVKKNTSKDTLRLIAYLLGLLAIPAVFVLLISVNFYFAIVAICAGFFVIYAAYYLITGMYIEYEYAVTNSNITVDKVIAKRKRKRVISVDIKRFNTLKKLKESDFDGKSYKKIFRASITPDGEDVYGAEMHLDKFGGTCLLLFSPGEKTLDAMKPYLKNVIKIELFKNFAKKSASKSNGTSQKNSAKTKTAVQDSDESSKDTSAKADSKRNKK